MALIGEAGFFGKLPAYGDFIHRNVPNAAMTQWDEWLKSYVGATQERLGDNWLDVYLTSPIWRFCFSAGVLDEQSWAGILLPSVDRVGRYFPFTVLQALDPSIAPAAFITEQSAWYDAIEQQALQALDGSLDAEALAEALAEPLPDSRLMYAPQAAPSAEAGVVIDVTQDALPMSSSLSHLLDVFIRERFVSHGVWQTNGSERVEPCLFVVNALPAVSGGSAMMDGLWEDWEWCVPWRLSLGGEAQ